MDNILFLTKDAMFRGYLPTYGNKYWKTPNIDELALKGTVFTKHYTGAPSTIMSNMCMFTQKFSHESELEDYIFSHIHYSGESLWTVAEQRGYECHIIWDEAWKTVFKAEERYYCYGENTTIHYLKNIRQGVGSHYIHNEVLQTDSAKTNATLSKLAGEINDIVTNAKKPVFLWLHIPHVINGRTGYGTDIDVFDSLVGIAREYFHDDNIFISADHGNMNCVKGKIGYGHDVYEPSINIPLITPRISGKAICDSVTSNIDITKIIFDRTIAEREYVYSDSAFYGQENRKLAIISGNFKYIYNKKTKVEELYDLEEDPEENCNLMKDIVYDIDRKVNTPLRELYFYTKWDQLDSVRERFIAEKNRVWRNGSNRVTLKSKVKRAIHNLGYDKIRHWIRVLKAMK